MAYGIKLTKIHCNSSSDGSGNDDVYVAFRVDGGDTQKVPSEPDTTHSWDIDQGQEVALQPNSSLQDGSTLQGSDLKKMFERTVSVELWDYDSGSSDDSLGSFTADTSEGSFSATVTGDGGSYTVGYDIKNVDF